jgi:hypothetical protein
MTVRATAEIAEHYEALRAAALAHHLDTDRRGLALLRREGVAAWAAAWASCSPPPDHHRERAYFERLADPTALVSLLASMTLSTLQEHL